MANINTVKQGSVAPHIRNTKAGLGKWDPMHNSIFEVLFKVPKSITGVNAADVTILTQHVTTVSGLDVLQKTTTAGEQKFLGATVSYLNPVLDTTAADITIEFNLSMRDASDAFILKIFKEWSKLGYDLQTGLRRLKADYVADTLIVNEANRDGTVWRNVKFYNVMLTGVTGIDGLDYTGNEARKITCTFRSDYWDETLM